jgi:CRISPR-associated protein Csb1
MWDSTGPKGGLGVKFERAIVSEVVGVGAAFGVKTQSRIDPLIQTTANITLYKDDDGSWTLESKNEKGETRALFGSKKHAGKVSAANLGNVTPSFSKYTDGAEGLDPLKSGKLAIEYASGADRQGFSLRKSIIEDAEKDAIAAGGVTIEYAEQTTTLSLIALRRLRFPATALERSKPELDDAARTVIAALGICAATLAFEGGMDLRSRCLLWPEEALAWELLKTPGQPPEQFALDRAGALELLTEAVAAAERRGVEWQHDTIVLKPKDDLVKLIRHSQEESTKGEGE